MEGVLGPCSANNSGLGGSLFRTIALCVHGGLTLVILFFFFNVTATTEIYTLSLHDALPISPGRSLARSGWSARPRSGLPRQPEDRKSTRLNSSHVAISYAVFCLKKKKT